MRLCTLRVSMTCGAGRLTNGGFRRIVPANTARHFWRTILRLSISLEITGPIWFSVGHAWRANQFTGLGQLLLGKNARRWAAGLYYASRRAPVCEYRSRFRLAVPFRRASGAGSLHAEGRSRQVRAYHGSLHYRFLFSHITNLESIAPHGRGYHW